MAEVPSGAAPGNSEDLQAPRRVFERILLRQGSLRGLGKSLGRSTMWVWRQLRQNKSVDLEKTAAVLARLGIPVHFFYQEILASSPPYDPPWLLLYHREGKGLPRDPFLVDLQDRFSRLLGKTLVSSLRERRRQQIEKIEEKSWQDLRAAKNQLESLGRELLVLAEAAAANDRGLSRRHLADCAHLLLVWGVLQRARGRRNDSVDAYVLAYRLAVAGRDSWVLGVFHHYGSHLLLELGHPDPALRFAEQACRLFQLQRDRSWLARALVHTSLALSELGRKDQARKEAIAALRLAPSVSWRTRASAWLLLGHIALASGHDRRALGLVCRAKRQARAESLQAQACWREAAVLARLGRLREASVAFRSALKLFEGSGQPLDVAFVAIDLVEMLIRAGRSPEALKVAQALTPRFERMKGQAQAFELWMDLCALLLTRCGESSSALVARIRETLRKADPKIRPDDA